MQYKIECREYELLYCIKQLPRRFHGAEQFAACFDVFWRSPVFADAPPPHWLFTEGMSFEIGEVRDRLRPAMERCWPGANQSTARQV